MTTYAVTHEVPESKRWYITPGKHYEVQRQEGLLAYIVADDGNEDPHLWENDPHLDGGSWQRASYHFWGIHDDEVV